MLLQRYIVLRRLHCHLARGRRHHRPRLLLPSPNQCILCVFWFIGPPALAKSNPIQIYPELKGLGSEGHSHRARSAEDDIADVHTLRTAHSSLTMWTNARGAPTSDTSSMTDDDDRTLPVYQPHSVRQSTIESKAMLVVEPHDPGSGFWKAFMLWFDSFLNSLKACLSGT